LKKQLNIRKKEKSDTSQKWLMLKNKSSFSLLYSNVSIEATVRMLMKVTRVIHSLAEIPHSYHIVPVKKSKKCSAVTSAGFPNVK